MRPRDRLPDHLVLEQPFAHHVSFLTKTPNRSTSTDYNPQKINRIQIFINVFTEYPLPKVWKQLKEELSAFLKEFSGFGVQRVARIWDIHLGGIDDPNEQLHPASYSYTLIISCQYHRNEEKNLVDKLDEACANLVKQSKEQTEHTINSILIKIPPNASITACEQWGREYLERYPERPIVCIMFYQVSYVTDTSRDINFIQHCFKMVQRDAFYKRWNPTGHRLTFNIPVGVYDDRPSRDLMILEIAGQKQEIEIHSRYFFQKGERYLQ